MTHIGMRPLTRLQADVLYIVGEHGPVTPADVDYHLHLDRGRARSVLATLERRTLVDAQYTGMGRRTGRAFVITDAGEAVVTEQGAGDD